MGLSTSSDYGSLCPRNCFAWNGSRTASMGFTNVFFFSLFLFSFFFLPCISCTAMSLRLRRSHWWRRAFCFVLDPVHYQQAISRRIFAGRWWHKWPVTTKLWKEKRGWFLKCFFSWAYGNFMKKKIMRGASSGKDWCTMIRAGKKKPRGTEGGTPFNRLTKHCLRRCFNNITARKYLQH